MTYELTWASMLQHCCNRETGGLPRLVASWTRSSCSFCVGFSIMACNIATEANHVDNESTLKSPPHKSCPAVIVLTEIDDHKDTMCSCVKKQKYTNLFHVSSNSGSFFLSFHIGFIHISLSGASVAHSIRWVFSKWIAPSLVVALHFGPARQDGVFPWFLMSPFINNSHDDRCRVWSDWN